MIVFESFGETQHGSHEALAEQLSNTFGGALAVMNHNDDLLRLAAVDGGIVFADYDCESGGDASADLDAAPLIRLAGAGSAQVVAEILRTDFVFAFERHQDLVTELNLPAEAVGLGFTYIDQGDGPSDAERVAIRD